MTTLKSHRLFFMILFLHLLLALAYASGVPLGEAPDEPAHLSYARFIARQGRLPATLAERGEAGYRSTWPPLYHGLVAGPLAFVGEAPPARLKAVGDTPRRLIPTNGQTIAAFIHTVEEAWPWQGLPLAWRLGRLISVLLLALAVVTTYLIAWRLTGQRLVAAGAAAFHAFLPQALFIGSVVNDDNLLVLLAGLGLLIMVSAGQAASFPTFDRFFGLGIVLGLATVAKYNALPLWALAAGWLAWLIYRHRRQWGETMALAFLRQGVYAGSALLLGAALAAGWWFLFIWRAFNQVERQGWLQGSLAALSAGTADASLRRLAAGEGQSFGFPALAAWGEWGATFFRSFWGLFGGGGTIAWPGWVYWLLAALTLLAVGGWLLRGVKAGGSEGQCVPLMILIGLAPLLFLPLPLLRFILTGGHIAETAQGRHLFPALPAIALIVSLGLTHLGRLISRGVGMKLPGPAAYCVLGISLLLVLNLYSLGRIRASYPPLLPVYTTAGKIGSYQPVEVQLAETVRLIGYELGPAQEGILTVTLLWRAEATPAEDYLVNLAVTDAAGQLRGGWRGHPLGGRYPTRAWDEGDIVRDTIPVPVLAGPAGTSASLSVTLLDSTAQPVTDPFILVPALPLPASAPPKTPAELRADGLAAAAPFSYRGTLSVVGPGQGVSPALAAPDGRRFEPDWLIEGEAGSLAQFIVGPDWPSGNYQLTMGNDALPIPVSNRLRQFEPPLMGYSLLANFAGQITVLGYDLPQRVVEPGGQFPLTLHLRAERVMGQNLVIFNHLLDAQASQRGGVDRIPQNYYTTLLWVPGEIVSDAYQVPVDAGAPPGVYWLDLGFYPDKKPEFSLPRLVDGQPDGRNSVTIGPVKVGGPPAGVTTVDPVPQHPLAHTFGDQIALLGFDLEDGRGQPAGSKPGLRLFWQAATRPQADYTVFIHLLNAAGELAAQADGPPAGGAYPTSLWEAGEIIVDERTLPDLPPGHYTLRLGLYQPGSGDRLPVSGSPDSAVTLLEFEASGLP